MLAYYETISEIKRLLDIIDNAIENKLKIIEIKDNFGEMNKYRIFYNVEDLLEYNELELHISVEYDEVMMQEPKDTVVIAFDFNISSLLENKTVFHETIHFTKLVFVHGFNMNFHTFIDNDKEDLNIEFKNTIDKLYIVDCLFCEPITLSFDWDTIELTSSIFLDRLIIYDLYSELKSYYCYFDVVFMENHEFNKLEFNSCEAKRLELYPDQQDLDMESININYSKLEELVINSREYYNREYNEYDIEVDFIKINDSNIEKIIISDIQVEKLSIKRSICSNLILNKVISDNYFIFKDLNIGNIKFINTFVKGEKVFESDYKFTSLTSPTYYDKYTKGLQDLSNLDDNPQSRGFAFEKYLESLFEINGLQPRGSFKIEGEQIDGSFVLHDEVYLIEAKWTNKPIDKGELVIFNEKVSSKSGFTRGLFISYSGYSKEALNTFDSGRTVNIVLMTVKELEILLSKKMDFKEFIWAKVRALAEEGDFNKLIVT